MASLLRIVGIIAWVAFMFAMLSLPDTLLTLIGALAGTVLAGWLIARWWALLVPVGLGVFWLIGSASSVRSSWLWSSRWGSGSRS